MLEDRQTNIGVLDKLVAAEDGLMNCQFEILKSDQTRRQVVRDASLSSQLCRRCQIVVGRDTCAAGFSEVSRTISATAFLVEDATERRLEQGTLDEPDDDPVTGNRFAGAAERAQALFDLLQLDCVPASEQDRRAAWLSMPRHVRAAIQRLHVMINHHPEAVKVQIKHERSTLSTQRSHKELNTSRGTRVQKSQKQVGFPRSIMKCSSTSSSSTT